MPSYLRCALRNRSNKKTPRCAWSLRCTRGVFEKTPTSNKAWSNLSVEILNPIKTLITNEASNVYFLLLFLGARTKVIVKPASVDYVGVHVATTCGEKAWYCRKTTADPSALRLNHVRHMCSQSLSELAVLARGGMKKKKKKMRNEEEEKNEKNVVVDLSFKQDADAAVAALLRHIRKDT